MQTYQLPTAIDVTILSETERALLFEAWGYFLKYPGSEIDKKRFVKALVYAYELHALDALKTGKKRESGESYFIHDLRCVNKVLIAGCELKMAIIMLCHEFIEDDGWTMPRLRKIFGKQVAHIVLGITKPPRFPERSERVKTYLAIIVDAVVKKELWQVLLAKIVDRSDNCRDTIGLTGDSITLLFNETEQAYLPVFEKYMNHIPPTLLSFCRSLVSDIKYAITNHRSTASDHHAPPS